MMTFVFKKLCQQSPNNCFTKIKNNRKIKQKPDFQCIRCWLRWLAVKTAHSFFFFFYIYWLHSYNNRECHWNFETCNIITPYIQQWIHTVIFGSYRYINFNTLYPNNSMAETTGNNLPDWRKIIKFL